MRFSSTAKFAALLIFVAIFSGGIAFGQQVTGTILGRVTDSTGSVVPGATVLIQNPATGFSRTDTADSDGRYFESNLPLGTYTVTVSKDGFQTLLRSGIQLTVGSEVTINAELVVGNVQQHVEVTGEAPSIETSNATISGLVSQDQLRDLPLNGRSVDSLALLSPGIFANRASAPNTTVGMGLHIAVNGNRQDWNLFLLDGTVINDAISGRSSAAGEAMGVEGILEFRILTHGASAEYGRTAGGIVSAVTRSGTNQFHGSAYEFLRNTVLNAQNFFAQSLPAYHRNQFGAAVGGPIVKNKLFFFANYEGLRARQSTPVTSYVPDATFIADSALNIKQILTDLYPHNIAPNSDVMVPGSATILPMNGSTNPGPNGFGIGTAVNNYTQPITENYTMVRVDYKISDKDSAFARFVYDPSSTALNNQVPTFVSQIGGDDRFLALSETHIFSASTLNEFRFAFNRTTPVQNSYALFNVPLADQFVPGAGFGSITFGATATGTANGLSVLGISQSVPQNFTKNLIQESDTVTIVKGEHTFKFGADVEREQLNTNLNGNLAGNYQFSSPLTMFNGAPSTYVQEVLGPNPIYPGKVSTGARSWRRTLFGTFVQDDIRLRPNLTVNLGLRWEFMSNPVEVNGRSGALINITDSNNTAGPPFLAPKLNFAPRAGFAWDPTGSGKTSIRGAIGIYDNQLDDRMWYANATNNANYLVTYQVSTPTFPTPGALTSAGSPKNQQIQFNSKEPTVYEWNLEVQRQFTPSLSLRVAYVGSRGIHLPGEAELDTRVPTFGANGDVASYPTSSSAPRINTNFSTLFTTLTGFSSDYNALQTMLEKKLSYGLNFQVSYTLSKAMSDADQITSGQVNSVPGTAMDPYNLNRDYSLSAFNQKNTLVANFAYQMPWDKWVNGAITKRILGGWSMNGIYSFGSGLPFDILDGFNNSNDGNNSYLPDRPNLNSGFSTNPTHGVSACINSPITGKPQQLHTTAMWYDPCAFSLSPAGTYGDLGRNTVIGPHLSELDFTLVKTTAITEGTKLEFRAECFNLFNHPNFGLPVNNISSSSRLYSGSAGAITTTSTDNRDLQIGLKFLF